MPAMTPRALRDTSRRYIYIQRRGEPHLKARAKHRAPQIARPGTGRHRLSHERRLEEPNLETGDIITIPTKSSLDVFPTSIPLEEFEKCPKSDELCQNKIHRRLLKPTYFGEDYGS